MMRATCRPVAAGLVLAACLCAALPVRADFIVQHGSIDLSPGFGPRTDLNAATSDGSKDQSVKLNYQYADQILPAGARLIGAYWQLVEAPGDLLTFAQLSTKGLVTLWNTPGSFPATPMLTDSLALSVTAAGGTVLTGSNAALGGSVSASTGNCVVSDGPGTLNDSQGNPLITSGNCTLGAGPKAGSAADTYAGVKKLAALLSFNNGQAPLQEIATATYTLAATGLLSPALKGDQYNYAVGYGSAAGSLELTYLYCQSSDNSPACLAGIPVPEPTTPLLVAAALAAGAAVRRVRGRAAAPPSATA